MHYLQGVNRNEMRGAKAVTYLEKQCDTYLMALWASPETTKENREIWEWQFRALRSTYGINLQIVYDPKDWMDLHTIPSCAIQQKSEGFESVEIRDFIHPPRCVYYVGNSKYTHPAYNMKTDFIVHIEAPEMYAHPLYGHQAASIVLHDRYIKNANL